MSTVSRGLCSLLIVIAAATAAAGEIQQSEGPVKSDLYWEGMIRRDEVRFERTWTEGFVDILGIEEGMTVLDIGTGTGRYALAFAGKMGGTGRVYATDIVPALVKSLDEEARGRGLYNLSPVLVGKDGLDEFYLRHTYDLVTLFHASVIHLGKVEYFRELRKRLAPRGRLVVTYQIKFPPFSAGDIVDFSGLAGELAALPDESPFSGPLRESTRKLLKSPDRVGPSGESLEDAIVEDFNGILDDVRFGSAFADGMTVRRDLAFTPTERAFADWLLLYIKSKGVFDGAELSFGDRKNSATLNRLLLAQRFREYFSPEVAAPYGHGGHGEGVRKKLEEAGYTLEGVYDDIVPFEITLVFSGGGEGE